MDRQCSSCGGFCRKSGCERENVKPEPEPVAWIKARELTYMKAVIEHGSTEWKTNLGLKPEDGDVPLYTAPPKKKWVGLTDEELAPIYAEYKSPRNIYVAIEAKLKNKNT